MRHLHKKLLCALCIIALAAGLAVPVSAAQEIPTYEISDAGIEMIIGFEGLAVHGMWDYAQWSIGYGTNYEVAIQLFPEIAAPSPADATITEEQAREVLRYMLLDIGDVVNRFLRQNGIAVNQNQFDALVSFTASLGGQWIDYRNEDGTPCMLVKMLKSDPSTWTLEKATEAFTVWSKAGGQVLPGLARRREAEAVLFMTPVTESPNPVGGLTESTEQEDSQSSEEPDPTVIPEPSVPVGPEIAPVLSALEFLDVPTGQWYTPYVTQAVEYGLMKGYGDGYFGPEDHVTRAQLLQALANFDGVDLSRYNWDVDVFEDVPSDAWYSPAVAWGLEQNLVDRTQYLYPDQVLQRQEMCVILARYLSRFQFQPVRTVSPFLDEDQMTPAAQSAVYYCAQLGFIDGIGDGSFDPAGSLTRGQVAKILLGVWALFR